jgi:hypothetical protein
MQYINAVFRFDLQSIGFRGKPLQAGDLKMECGEQASSACAIIYEILHSMIRVA